VLVRSGQVARIGRTEWADFSFPRDGELAEVHFAVQCQLHGAKVRKLAAEGRLTVNSQDVNEADLQPGDTIEAGQSAFVVVFDGQGAERGSGTTGTVTGTVMSLGTAVGFVAVEGAGAAQEREPTALEIAEELQMADEHVALARTVKTGPEFVAALAAAGALAKAVRVQAHLLSKRQCVWWGVLCVEDACAEALSEPEANAKLAAREWLEEPGENRRRRCESAAGKTKLDGPGSWLAMGAFWSGGSIAPEEMGEVAPDDKLTGQAISSSLMIAAVTGDATKAKDRYRAFLAKAPDVASGRIPLPEKK
jgi:hypothetical protein